MQQTLERLQNHAKNLKDGLERVRPGDPYTFSSAADAGEGVWQGDLGIEIVRAIPKDYVKVTKPTAAHMKLVPGGEDGAKHHLDSLAGVTLYLPPEFEKDPNSLRGPAFKISEPRQIVHTGSGRHGTVNLDPTHAYQCRYQRVWEQEEQRERRARD